MREFSHMVFPALILAKWKEAVTQMYYGHLLKNVASASFPLTGTLAEGSKEALRIL
jgi:hypothetical protein